MVPPSPPDETTAALEAQIRECFGRVVYSTKTHEKCADMYATRLQQAKWTQIVLSALTTGGLLAATLGAPEVSHPATVAAAIVSTILLVVNAYMKNFEPGQLAEEHKKTASELWDVRESYLSILTDLHGGHLDISEARKRRDDLQERLVKIYATAPRTSAKAYWLARLGLKKHEELTFSDDEIDEFLPSALHRARQGQPQGE